MRRLSAAENQQLEESLKYMIGQKPRSLKYLFHESAFRQEEIVTKLRELMRKGIVVMDNEDIFSLSRR